MNFYSLIWVKSSLKKVWKSFLGRRNNITKSLNILQNLHYEKKVLTFSVADCVVWIYFLCLKDLCKYVTMLERKYIYTLIYKHMPLKIHLQMKTEMAVLTKFFSSI